jgi:hypothetical protein
MRGILVSARVYSKESLRLFGVVFICKCDFVVYKAVRHETECLFVCFSFNDVIEIISVRLVFAFSLISFIFHLFINLFLIVNRFHCRFSHAQRL